MPKLARLLPILCLSLLTIGSGHAAWAEDLLKLYEQMRVANQMDAIGRDAFYIKIAAQLYDLDGKASDMATVEEWWDAGRYRIEITEPSGKFVQTSDPDSKHLPLTRTAYLLRGLLDETVNPLRKASQEETFTSVDREVSGTKFRCLVGGWYGKVQEPSSQTLYCTIPGSTDLSLNIHSPTSLHVRQKIALFHGFGVPLKTQTIYLGRLAIAGEVKGLQSFDVKTSTFPEFREGAPGSDEQESKPGKWISGDRPTLPKPANLPSSEGGCSLILLSISATGGVDSADVIASTSSFLSAGALRAVRTYKFAPWLRDSKPTEGHVLFQYWF